MVTALIVLTILISACTKREDHRMVGELERLGPDGRDYLILGVDAPGFDKLTLNQKKLAYYLYRAAIAGDNLMYLQNHRYALGIKNMLEAIYLHSEGLDEASRNAVQDYLKYIWINHGQYQHYTHEKFVPNYLTPEMLKKAIEYAEKNGAKFTLMQRETLDDKLTRLNPHIFDEEFEPILVNQEQGVDIIAESAVNLYDPEIVEEELNQLPDFWRNKLNVRFAKVGDKIEPQEYKIGGLYSDYLETIVFWLEKALPFAEGEEQAKGLRALIDYYKTGDEALFREYSIYWLKSNTTIDYLNGFIEQYMDPRGVIGQFEGNVSYVADSKLIDALADNALYFEKRMPWPDKYKRTEIDKPVANVVNVIVETGDSGPISPAAYNLPNYSDIRRDFGSKNIILLNIESARSEKIRDTMVNEFYLPEYRELYKKYQPIARQWLVYMHEVIGHGSGQPEPDLSADPRTLIGRGYSALEETRSDVVGLYHIFDDKLVEIGAFSKDEQDKVILALYVYFLQDNLTSYRRLDGDVVREAHDRGQQLVMSYLLEGGETGDKDFGVQMIEKDGNYYIKVNDVNKARQGIAAILNKLQTLKSTGDSEGTTQFFDRFGSRVNPQWRENIRKRAERILIPKYTAFVFPQLIPVAGEDGDIVDVQIAFEEDLTAQQLRFSRLQFDTEIFVQEERGKTGTN
jgi:dipeptidyl-peptidase-3